MLMSRYSVEYYTTESGRCPVEEFIDKLSQKTQAKVFYYLTQLEYAGLQLGPPALAKIDDVLWELRIIADNTKIRIFFSLEKSAFIMYHALKKKQQKLPKTDIETAKNRWQRYKSETK